MEATFFEEHLHRDLYEPKKVLDNPKKPMRILVTDAGGKIAYNIIYELCSGNVFGPDQEIIIHLINSRGSMPHKSVFMELQQCGFSTCTDFVVSSDPEIAFSNVELVIAIATYEEIPGRSISSTMVYQIIKARQVAVHVQQFASKDAKIVFVGPSTKSLTVLLSSFRKFAPNIELCNITAVTMLDAVISKHILAAKLKTTTDKIKNVFIWGCTYPDVLYATVSMYPPGDRGKWKVIDVPLCEAIPDGLWLFRDFPQAIYRRIMSPDLLRYGKAVTQAVVLHLRYLFGGSDKFDEVPSMSVITPAKKIHGIPPDIGFSFPVSTENGTWKILENVRYDTGTHLNILRSIFNLTQSPMLHSMNKVVSRMLEYEAVKHQVVDVHNKFFFEEVIDTRNWLTSYFVTPSPSEGVLKGKDRTRESKKSIAWNDGSSAGHKKFSGSKSVIRFSLEKHKKEFDRKLQRGLAFASKSESLLPPWAD